MLIRRLALLGQQHFSDSCPLIRARYFSQELVANWSEAIKIPKRIERGPTDILKALASTVKHVPTEPDQLMLDDPFFMPYRPSQRNINSLARLSGRNAAKFILNKHPELFYRDDSEPKVRSFLPPEEYRDDMNFDVNDLKWCIDNSDPINGIVAYNSLINKQVKLDDETLMQFFELLCYTNEEKTLDHIDILRNNLLKDTERDLLDTSWKTNGLVGKIFNQIKGDLDAPRVYSAMIAGLSRFNEHTNANQVFLDFIELCPSEALYPEAYDGLLNSVPNLNSSVETANKAINTIVRHMEDHLVQPNLRVINTMLLVYSKFFCDNDTIKKAFSLVNDLRSLDIEPSLYTYTCLVVLMGKNRGFNKSGEHMSDLLDYIHRNDQIIHELRDERDAEFLVTSMRVFANQMYNLNLGNKLHKIYIKRPTLFPHVGKRNNYLNNYFRLIISSGKLEHIVQFYNEYAPMNFRPTDDNYEALNELLDLYR